MEIAGIMQNTDCYGKPVVDFIYFAPCDEGNYHTRGLTFWGWKDVESCYTGAIFEWEEGFPKDV